MCDMPEPCKFPFLDTCRKKFLWTYKEGDLNLHPVGDMEKFPHALGFKGLDPFFRCSMQGLCFKAIEEDGGDKRPVRLKFACEADGVPSPDLH